MDVRKYTAYNPVLDLSSVGLVPVPSSNFALDEKEASKDRL